MVPEMSNVARLGHGTNLKTIFTRHAHSSPHFTLYYFDLEEGQDEKALMNKAHRQLAEKDLFFLEDFYWVFNTTHYVVDVFANFVSGVWKGPKLHSVPYEPKPLYSLLDRYSAWDCTYYDARLEKVVPYPRYVKRDENSERLFTAKGKKKRTRTEADDEPEDWTDSHMRKCLKETQDGKKMDILVIRTMKDAKDCCVVVNAERDVDCMICGQKAYKNSCCSSRFQGLEDLAEGIVAVCDRCHDDHGLDDYVGRTNKALTFIGPTQKIERYQPMSITREND